jgi:Holliday junction resolvasome RuvABC endonuclease subunit
MNVLGLDVQMRRVGFGLVYTDGEKIEPLFTGYAQTVGNPGDFLRAFFSKLVVHEPSVIYVEDAHVGASRRIAVEHAKMVGRALQEAEKQFPDAAVQTIQPKEWRMLVGLGGNARKEQVMAWANLQGFFAKTQDEADAAAIAWAGAVRNGHIVSASGA